MLGNCDSLRRNTKIVHTPKNGAADGKKLYTVLEYKEAEFTTAEGKDKKSKTGLVEHYVNKFGSSGDAVSEFHYAYDEWGNITYIHDDIVNEEEGYQLFIGDEGNTAPVKQITDEGPENVIFRNEYTDVSAESSTSVAAGTTGSGLQTEKVYKKIEPLVTGRRYTYNDLGEVLTARETYSDKTTKNYAYTYDEGGNTLTETIDGTVHTYAYDSTWKDKLISYDGKAITYDVFGCPLDYMGTAMTWDIYGGLTSVDNGTDSISYTYMGDGQRRSKTVNGVTTTYHYNNGMLLSETTGDETLRYYYDSTGKVASIVYKKGDGEETGYFYARNAQGDIIAVYRSKDSKLMGTYEYDLWGRLISATATDDDTDNITNKNPYRYRGYYYDKETGFYYLTARYYDPQIRRFISADSMNALMIATTDVTCKNLFVYAENNPVTGKDSSGNFVDTVFDVISLAGSIADVYKNPTDPLAWASLAGDAADVLIPGVSGIGEVIKGAKAAAIVAETAKVASGAGAVAEGAIKAKKAIGNLVDGAKKLGKKIKGNSSFNGLQANQGFESFGQLKKAIGSPGEGKHWHHIVEQSQISKSGFSAKQIHNTSNIIAVDKATHAKITGYYNTKSFDFTGGSSVREWLVGQSYEKQHEFGVDVLKQYGVIR